MKGKIMTLSLNTNEYHGRERIFYSMKLQKEHDSQAVGSGSSFQNNITNSFLKYRARDFLAYIQLQVTEGIYRVADKHEMCDDV